MDTKYTNKAYTKNDNQLMDDEKNQLILRRWHQDTINQSKYMKAGGTQKCPKR